MRKIIVALCLLSVFIFVSLTHASAPKTNINNHDHINTRLFIVLANNETNITNASIMPLVKIELKNGTILNLTTIDDMLYLFYNGSLDVGSVENINMTTIDEYIAYLNASKSGESINVTYYFSYKLFYSKLESKIEKYNGSIVPVDADDFINNSHGAKYTKAIIGIVHNINTTSPIDGVSNILELDYDLFIFVYVNCSDIDIMNLEADIQSVIGENNQSILPVIIDISNSYNFTNVNSSLSNAVYIHDNQTYIYNASEPSTYLEFTTSNNSKIPLVIIIDRNGIIWWKNYGFEGIPELELYVDMYLNESLRSLPVYPILDVIPDEPTVNKTCSIYVVLGFGFGNITSLKLYYELLDEENETITYSSEPVEVSLDTLSYELSKINSSARWLVVNATVWSEFGVYKSKRYIYKIYVPKKPEMEIPSWVWKLVASIIIVVIVISLGIRLYRKYFRASKK